MQEGEPGVVINDSHRSLHIDAMDLGTNNIGMRVGRTNVQILEHVIGASA